MRIKLSNGMKRCIEETKARALVLVEDIPLMGNLKIQQKVTKNKTFEFHVINLRKPIIKLFINDRFYKSYIYSKGVWTEEA